MLKLADEPLHTVVLDGCEDMAGAEVIETVNEFPALLQPSALVTVSVPVYVPAATPAGIEKVTWLAGKLVLPVFTNPAARAAAFQAILQLVGLLVVAE